MKTGHALVLAGLRLISVIALALLAQTPAGAARGQQSPSESPTVLVAGASGQTGRLVIEHAQAAGYRVRAMARDPSAAKREIRGPYDWVKGDVREPASLAAALAGATYVICTIGATERYGPNSPEFVDYGGVRNLADAAVASGVSHFVLISSAGVEGGGGAFAWLLNKVLMPGILDWKAKGEQHVRASGLAYTIIRPGGLTGEAGSRAGLRFTQGDTLGGGTIPRADLAELAVFVLGRPEAIGKTFEVASDESAPVDAWRKALVKLEKD
jgi:uncharacterized protein YbjT (DUF2867 family)